MLKVEFIATLPAIQSALTVSGDNSGGKIKLEFDNSQTPEAIKVLLLAGKLFKVTITEEE